MKKRIAMLLAAAMALCAGWAAAMQEHVVSDSSGVEIIAHAEDEVCTGHMITGSSDRHTITVSGKHQITIEDVQIDVDEGCAFEIKSGASVILTLSGMNNNFQSGAGRAGIEVPAGASLAIKGGGSLVAQGGTGAAGIGGGNGQGSGTITIESGEIYATGGAGAAGIGNGYGEEIADTTIVKISGGEVYAMGGEDAAGIGIVGSDTNDGVVISGGYVNANGNGKAAGISCKGGRVVIANSQVYAMSLDNYTGVGVRAKRVQIDSGTVVADGDKQDIDAETIFINGGSVKANKLSVKPTDSNNNPLEMQEIVLIGAALGTPVKGLYQKSGERYSRIENYPLDGVLTLKEERHANSVIYVWLPNGVRADGVVAGKDEAVYKRPEIGVDQFVKSETGTLVLEKNSDPGTNLLRERGEAMGYLSAALEAGESYTLSGTYSGPLPVSLEGNGATITLADNLSIRNTRENDPGELTGCALLLNQDNKGSLRLELAGDVQINSEMMVAMRSDGDVTLSAAAGKEDAALTIGGTLVMNKSSLTLESGTLKTEGEAGRGVDVYLGELNVSGGRLIAASKRGGVGVSEGRMTVSGGVVEATSSQSHGMEISGSLTISGGSVTATSGAGHGILLDGDATNSGGTGDFHYTGGTLTASGGEGKAGLAAKGAVTGEAIGTLVMSADGGTWVRFDRANVLRFVRNGKAEELEEGGAPGADGGDLPQGVEQAAEDLPQTGSLPQTGDSSMLGAWAALLGASAVGIAARRRRG